jgi:murein DD-endopeptidase MepM/ murein hydrolase activator NlpD
MSFRYPLDTLKQTQGWGENAAYYKQYGQQGHNGNDYGTPVGTPVKASENGVIHFEGYGQNSPWMGGIAGVCCIIDHGSVYTGYAHLASTIVNRGQAVVKGQVIGYSGSTGASTGPHLHFEFIGKPINFNNGFAGRLNPANYNLSNAEMITLEQVKELYSTILERAADSGGIAHYAGKYTYPFVRSDLLASSEYKTLIANKEAAARARVEAEALVKLEAERKAAAIAEAERLAEVAKLQEQSKTSQLDIENNSLLKQILELLQSLVAKLTNIFK